MKNALLSSNEIKIEKSSALDFAETVIALARLTPYNAKHPTVRKALQRAYYLRSKARLHD